MIWACAYFTDFTDGWFLRCVHKMCEQTDGQTNMKRAITRTKINHLWNRYNMCMLRSWPTKIPNIPISRMVEFCESYSPFHVCLTIFPFAHLVYATSHLSFVTFYSYLVSWLAMIWACANFNDFTVCTCSDHGQSRYQIWIKCDKDKWLVAYTRYANGHMIKQTWKGL
jgi:hypothetical protein